MGEVQWRGITQAQVRDSYRKLEEAYQILDRRGERLIDCLKKEVVAARQAEDKPGETAAKEMMLEIAREIATIRERFHEKRRAYQRLLVSGEFQQFP